MLAADRDRFPFVDHPLGEATVQEIHLELIRRSQHDFFDGEDVLEDLLNKQDLWQAVLFDAPGLISRANSHLIKLRDMNADIYNVDTLYILAADEAAACRLAEFGETWSADWVEVYDEETTGGALGTSHEPGRLVAMWWD
jgi:hypothetical protein